MELVEFNKIKWTNNSYGEEIGFIDYGEVCAIILPENGATLSFEVHTYRKNPNSDKFLSHLGAVFVPGKNCRYSKVLPVAKIPKESRVDVVSTLRYQVKYEIESILNKLKSSNQSSDDWEL